MSKLREELKEWTKPNIKEHAENKYTGLELKTYKTKKEMLDDLEEFVEQKKEAKNKEQGEEKTKNDKVKLKVESNAYLPDGQFVENGEIIKVDKDFAKRVDEEGDNQFSKV